MQSRTYERVIQSGCDPQIIKQKEEFIHRLQASMASPSKSFLLIGSQKQNAARKSKVLQTFVNNVDKAYETSINRQLLQSMIREAQRDLATLQKSVMQTEEYERNTLTIVYDGNGTVRPNSRPEARTHNDYHWELKTKFEAWGQVGETGEDVKPDCTDGLVRLHYKGDDYVSNIISLKDIIKRQSSAIKRKPHVFDKKDPEFVSRCHGVAGRILRLLEPDSTGSGVGIGFRSTQEATRFSMRVFQDRVERLPDHLGEKYNSLDKIADLCAHTLSTRQRRVKDKDFIKMVEFCEPTIHLNPAGRRRELKKVASGSEITLSLLKESSARRRLDFDEEDEETGGESSQGDFSEDDVLPSGGSDEDEEEEEEEEELPMGTKVKYEQEDYTIKRRTNNGTYVLNTAAGKQALKGRGISKDQLTIVEEEEPARNLAEEETDDGSEEERSEEEAVEEEEEDEERESSQGDFSEDDVLPSGGSDEDEEEEEEEEELPVGTAVEYDQDNYTIRRITKKGTYVLNTLAGTQALNGRGISKDQLTIVEEEQSEEEQSEEESEEQSEEESKAVQTWDNYDGQSEEEQSEEELPMGTKVKYEQEDYTIKRRTNNGTYVLNTAAGKQALKGRGISKDQLTIVGKQSEDGQPVLVADTTDDEEEEEEEEAVEEEEESLAKMYEEVDLDDVDMLNLLGSDDDDVLNLLEEEEEEEKEDDIDTPEIEFRKAGFDTDQILNAAEDKTVSQGGLNDTGIERILKANKISSDGDDTDRLERLKMLVNGELFSMNDENTEASKFYYPDDYVPEQILNGSKGLTKSKDGLSKEDIKLILQLNGQPEDGKRKVLNKRLRAILPSEDELLAVSSSESDDDDDDVSDDDEDKRLGGGLAALEKMKQKRDDEDERNRARASIDRDRGRYSTRLQHTPGDLSMMLAEMSDDWATSEDELNFAEESDSEFKSSSGVDFAESSATSGPDFAESSSAETDDESLISSNALSFAESSASDGPVIPSSDAMEFAESSDAVSEKKTSDIDFAESSDYD